MVLFYLGILLALISRVANNDCSYIKNSGKLPFENNSLLLQGSVQCVFKISK